MRLSRLAVGIWILALAAVSMVGVSLLGGCGDDSGGPKDTTPPTVIGTTPLDGAANVSPYPVIRVWFSEAMDAASIDTSTFHVDGVPAYLVAYDATERKATLFPAGFLEPGTEHTARVETAVTDAAGNALEDPLAFDFTTGSLDCAHLSDRFEPNDDIASATPIAVNTIYPCLTSCGGQERYDYYRFTLTEAKQINVITDVASATTAGFQWAIVYVRQDGLQYVGSGTLPAAKDTLSLRHTFLPGTYWVYVKNYYADAYLIRYNLLMRALPPIPDDTYEDNDFPDQAAAIEPGLLENLKGTYVDADFFSIDLTADQTLTVTATEVSDTKKGYRLQIMNATGAVYTGGDGDNAHDTPAVASWIATEAGKHLVYVCWWGDNVTYSLNVEVSD